MTWRRRGFAGRGSSTGRISRDRFFRYLVSTDSWERIADAPFQSPNGLRRRRSSTGRSTRSARRRARSSSVFDIASKLLVGEIPRPRRGNRRHRERRGAVPLHRRGFGVVPVRHRRGRLGAAQLAAVRLRRVSVVFSISTAPSTDIGGAEDAVRALTNVNGEDGPCAADPGRRRLRIDDRSDRPRVLTYGPTVGRALPLLDRRNAWTVSHPLLHRWTTRHGVDVGPLSGVYFVAGSAASASRG